MTTTVRDIGPRLTRETNIAAANALAAVGIEAQTGWVDIGATYGVEPGDIDLFAEMFG